MFLIGKESCRVHLGRKGVKEGEVPSEIFKCLRIWRVLNITNSLKEQWSFMNQG